MDRTQRAIARGLLLAALLGVSGCSDRKPPEQQPSVEQEPAAPPPAVPEAVPDPVPQANLAGEETPQKPPPAEPPSKEAQMQDDAEASGMTSRLPDNAADAH
ncbi:hypothetical protein [Sphingomonas crusticola]|uniref:hypothetical protein n=1 Tax=Sphingomonas crusticola TaxID=1697973 RepID=UPI000E270AB0|nr:hypothetical protein [Sphingomonas crusticola]